MHRKTFTVIVAVLGALSLIAASAASAATVVGNTCTGDQGFPPGSTMVQLANPTFPGSLAVPQDGVITKWSVNVISYPGGISEKLKVLRPAAQANSFTAVGESTEQPLVSGPNSFDTRISVQAGDRLGAYSSFATIFCGAISAPTDVIGEFPSDLPVGSTSTFAEEPEGQLAMSATLEPDVDRDGYGDETQDKCPQDAAFQVPCPVVTLETFPVPAKKSVTLLVTDNSKAAVAVSGAVTVPKVKATKSGAKGKKAETIQLTAAGQTVEPGKIVRFEVAFSKSLQSRLKELSPKKSLTLNLTATATDSVNRLTTSAVAVKLQGQAKPKPKPKPKH